MSAIAERILVDHLDLLERARALRDGREIDGRPEKLLGPSGRPTKSSLSPRERQVLELLAAGGNDVRIASSLGTSTETVKRQIANARRFLGSRNRTHAVAIALRLGLIDQPKGGLT